MIGVFNLRVTRVLAVTAVLVMSAHRLPAPVQELPDSTPSVSPSASPTAKPNERRSSSPRSSPSAAAKKARTSASATPSRPAPAVEQPANARFAGKWVGIMPEVPWGDVPTELLVNQSETSMEWQESGRHKGTARAELYGGTMRARFPAGMTTATFTITPEADGKTAHVRLQAFMNDFSATFQRTGTGPTK